MISSWIERKLDSPVNENGFAARVFDMAINTPVIRWAVVLGLVAGLTAVVGIQQAEEKLEDTSAHLLSRFDRFRTKIFS